MCRGDLPVVQRARPQHHAEAGALPLGHLLPRLAGGTGAAVRTGFPARRRTGEALSRVADGSDPPGLLLEVLGFAAGFDERVLRKAVRAGYRISYQIPMC